MRRLPCVPVYKGSKITHLRARPGAHYQEQCYPRIMVQHPGYYVISADYIAWHVKSTDPRDAWAMR